MIKKLTYILILAIVIAVEYFLFGKRWKEQELLRRAMGIVTVLAWALPLAHDEESGYNGWLITATGFVVAGLVKVGLTIQDEGVDVVLGNLAQG